MNSVIKEIVRIALREDIGAGDVTSESVIEVSTRGQVVIVAKQSGVLAGIHVATEVFRQLSADVILSDTLDDGSRLECADVLCRIDGPLRAILAGERVALNFLQRMSGIATMTRRFLDAVGGTSAQILDTRK